MVYDYCPLTPTFKFNSGQFCWHATRGTANVFVILPWPRAISTYKYQAIVSFVEEQVNKTLQEWKEKPRNIATTSIHLSSDWTTAKTKHHICISIQDLSWDLSLITRKYHVRHLFTSNSLINLTPPTSSKCQIWQLTHSSCFTKYTYQARPTVILQLHKFTTYDNAKIHSATQTAYIYMVLMLHSCEYTWRHCCTCK